MELKELLAKTNGRNGLLTQSDATGQSAVNGQPSPQRGNVTVLEHGGVPTSPSRDSGNELSSESGNDENLVVGRNLVVAEDLTVGKKVG